MAADWVLLAVRCAVVLLVVGAQPNTAGEHVPVPPFKLPHGVPPQPATVPGPAPITQAGPAVAGRQPGIIRVSGLQFVQDDCTEWLPNGWNTYNDLMRAGAKAKGSGPAALASADDFVTRRYSQARAAGLNLVRMFATQGDNGTNLALEPRPGGYSERVFRGLDYAIAQAARFNIKVIIALNNYWENSDSVGNYIRWAGLRSKDQYWNSTRALDLTKAHIHKISTRKNVFNGNVYLEEPAIFAWNVMNEPRNPRDQTLPGFPEQTTAYINTVAKYIKSVDPWHLVTTGQEGFWPQGSLWARFNPWGQGPPRDWAYGTGQDFSAQHASPDIDFAVMHLWPDNWAELYDHSFVERWIEGHNLAAAALGKPLLLEEFGNIATGHAANLTTLRDPLYKTVYRAVVSSLDAGRPLRGALFWEWNTDGQRRGERAVETRDTAWRIVRAHGKAMRARAGHPVPGCTPVTSTAAAMAPPANPAATYLPSASPLPAPTRAALPAPALVLPAVPPAAIFSPSPPPAAVLPAVIAPVPAPADTAVASTPRAAASAALPLPTGTAPAPPPLLATPLAILAPSVPIPAPPAAVVLPATPLPTTLPPALTQPLPALAGEFQLQPLLTPPPLLMASPPPVVREPGSAAAGGGAGPVLLQGLPVVGVAADAAGG